MDTKLDVSTTTRTPAGNLRMIILVWWVPYLGIWWRREKSQGGRKRNEEIYRLVEKLYQYIFTVCARNMCWTRARCFVASIQGLMGRQRQQYPGACMQPVSALAEWSSGENHPTYILPLTKLQSREQ